MAMGKRKRERQEPLIVVASDLPRTPAHPFYRKLTEVLAGWQFDELVEGLCRPFCAEVMRRLRYRPAPTSACSCPATPRGSTPSGASPGGAETR